MVKACAYLLRHRYIALFCMGWLCSVLTHACSAARELVIETSPKGAITSKIKHAIKLKTSPARLAQLLHDCCSPHWYFVLACSQ